MPKKKITSEDEQLILRLYQEGKTGSEILFLLNGKFKTTKTIYDCLSKYRIKKKEKWEYSNHNHFYFDKIDTPNKAYVLGLMVADGWVCPKQNLIGLQLIEQDISIIKKVKKEWKTDNKIITCTKASFPNKDNTKIYTPTPMKRIAINSPKMIQSLSKLGVVHRKSKRVTLPFLKEYDSHMFRGIIDGDGSIYTHSNKKDKCIRILGSHYLVAQACLYLHMRLAISYRRPSSRENISFVDYSREDDVLALAMFLYKDIEDSFCIERKKNVVKDFLI